MPNRRYINGRAFEYRVKALFHLLGFVVVRSAGSKGAVDLFAARSGVQYLIQCKSGRARADRSEINRLIEAARVAGGTPILASARPRGAIEFLNAETLEPVVVS